MTDALGHVSSALTIPDFTVDNTVPPFLSFPDAPSGHDGTTTFTLTLQWSEPVYNFGLDDISRTNVDSASLQSANPSQQDTLTITPSGTGDIVLTIPAGVAYDSDINNKNTEATLTIPYDNQAPTYSVTRDDSNPTNASSLAFSVDFSEDVQNVDADDFELATTGTADGDATVEVSGSGSTYTVTIKNATGLGTLGLALTSSQDITDDSDNALNTTATANEVYDFDKVGPTFSIVRDDANPTNASTVEFSVDFSEDVIHISGEDFQVVYTGTATGNTQPGWENDGGR